LKAVLHIFIVCLALTHSIYAEETDVPTVNRGVIDLRGYLLDEPIELNGDWRFFWNRLLNPTTVAREKSDDFMCVPCLWKEELAPENLELTATGYATYHLTILLSENETDIGIIIPDTYMSSRLFLDGQEIGSVGVPAASKQSYSMGWAEKAHTLHAHSGQLEVVLQIANFHHSKGGLGQPILFGSKEAIMAYSIRQTMIDLFLTGSLFMGGLFFLGLFWFGRNERPVLYFSLFCFTYGYRILGAGNYQLQEYFPDMPFQLTYLLEYTSLFISAYLFMRYTRFLYPKETSRWIADGFGVISIILVGTTVFAPMSISSRIIEPYFILLLLGFMYILIVYSRAVFAGRSGAYFSLISTAIVIVVFVQNIMVYFQVSTEMALFNLFGYISFFFLQSLVLSYRFTNSFKSARHLAEQAAIAKTEFLSTMSHEIRTPLNAVIGMSHLLSENPRDDQEENVRTLEFSAKNLMLLINDILDYNKIDSGKLEFDNSEVDIRTLVQNLLQTYQTKADEKGIALELSVDKKVPQTIFTDHTRLSQVLSNLVSNAIKFTDKGRVEVSLKQVMRTKERSAIKFKVEDTGIGIPKEKQSMIFETFTQASSTTTRVFGGTGLGLAITKKLLHLQGVAIHLFSLPGKGSRFYFTQTFSIPKDSPKRVPSLQLTINEKQDQNLEGLTILLVEDNEVNVLVAKKFLTKWQANVHNVENGQEALDEITQGGEKYDLILMDLQMPVMDGYTASREIRKVGYQRPIIALTASALMEVEEKVKNAGMDDYVTKPFNPNDLLAKILRIHATKRAV